VQISASRKTARLETLNNGAMMKRTGESPGRLKRLDQRIRKKKTRGNPLKEGRKGIGCWSTKGASNIPGE